VRYNIEALCGHEAAGKGEFVIKHVKVGEEYGRLNAHRKSYDLFKDKVSTDTYEYVIYK
jgi:hypothetical protein